MSTVAETIDHLQKNFKPGDHVAVVIWGEEDVRERARQLHIRVNKAKVNHILDEVERRHDAMLGITWDTFDYYIEQSKNQPGA